MADEPNDILAVPTDGPSAVATPTTIDADELTEARRDDRWREFCLAADHYVAESTRPPVSARQPA
jgi:hypothetical protein